MSKDQTSPIAFTRSVSYRACDSDSDNTISDEEDARSYYTGNNGRRGHDEKWSHDQVSGPTINCPTSRRDPAFSTTLGTGTSPVCNQGYERARLYPDTTSLPGYDEACPESNQEKGQCASQRRRSIRNGVAMVVIIVLISVGIASGVTFGIVKAQLEKNKFVVSPGDCNEWTEWDACSVSCGIGIQTRNRTCYGNESHQWTNTFTDSMYCSEPTCVDTWREWSAWGSCSVTCGAGVRVRNRTCDGHFCLDNSVDKDVCYIGICLDKWGDWSAWSECSATCGAGMRTRDRNCIGAYCGDNALDKEVCNARVCIDAWSDWGSWSGCSRSCGTGSRTRSRTCGGTYCGDSSNDLDLCYNSPCQVRTTYTQPPLTRPSYSGCGSLRPCLYVVLLMLGFVWHTA